MSASILPIEECLPLDLMIMGMNFDEVLKNDRLEDILSTLEEEIGISRDKLSEIVDERYTNGSLPLDMPNVLKGIGGFSTLQFLQRALANIVPSPDFPERRTEVSGMIRDYVFVHESDHSQENYIASGSGHLAVEMITEVFDTNEDYASKNPSFRELIHWDIDIKKQGYKVFRRNPRDEVISGAAPPFSLNPGDLTFPPASINPANSQSIWCRGLDHKLFAKGPDAFEIHHVYRQINCDQIERIDEIVPIGGGDIDPWYGVTPESCIDLMFRGFPPATELPDQSGYCLGRCKSPDIVNTSGGE